VTPDVVCAGSLYLDLTFEGLDALPEAGRERFARELHETPGGAAITAIGLARLGLRVAVAAPLGRDVAGRTLRRLLEAEGVSCAGPVIERTPVTVVLPVDGERAMVTYEPDVELDAAAIARLRPRAVVVGADRLAAVPGGALAYATVGDAEADRHRLALPADVGRARALLANRLEAAALALAAEVETAVVTCGGDGAVAASGGELVTAAAPEVAVCDTTGAGDLLAAAYVWGDLAGLPLHERLRRAVLYATLSVRKPTGARSAPTLQELERASAGLESALSTAAKEQP
jgi:ribokinase